MCDEVCIVCGEIVKQGEVIPATGEPAVDDPTDEPTDEPSEPKGGFDFISKLLTSLTELFRMFTRWIQK